MPYDEHLEERLNQIMQEKGVGYEARKMMGGLCYMVDDKMCFGIQKESMMVRIDPETYEQALSKPGARTMDFTKRPMKGFLFIDAEGIDMDQDLEYWVDQCLEFNPKAKRSKKRRKRG